MAHLNFRSILFLLILLVGCKSIENANSNVQSYYGNWVLVEIVNYVEDSNSQEVRVLNIFLQRGRDYRLKEHGYPVLELDSNVKDLLSRQEQKCKLIESIVRCNQMLVKPDYLEVYLGKNIRRGIDQGETKFIAGFSGLSSDTLIVSEVSPLKEVRTEDFLDAVNPVFVF